MAKTDQETTIDSIVEKKMSACEQKTLNAKLE